MLKNQNIKKTIFRNTTKVTSQIKTELLLWLHLVLKDFLLKNLLKSQLIDLQTSELEKSNDSYQYFLSESDQAKGGIIKSFPKKHR